MVVLEDNCNVEQLHDELYQNFLDQDYENEYFDVIFYVEGRELYAHGQILAAASPVFKKQLLQNRSNGNGPIQINDYSYDEFFEFLRLIYYDFLQVLYVNFDDIDFITIHESYFVIVKLAIVHEAERILQICKKSHWKKIEDFFEHINFLLKYSNDGSKEFLTEMFDNHFYDLIEFDGFINLDKSVINAFVIAAAKEYVDEKDLFEAIYKWGEYQSMITVEMPKKEKNQLILHQIKDFLPLFNLKFLLEFVVPKGLITVEEANEYKTVEVTIKSEEKSICGAFVDSYGIFEYIKSNENDEDFEDILFYLNCQRCVWKKIFEIPSNSNPVEKLKGCNWYLLFGKNGKLNLKHESMIKKTDYLIAEMKEIDADFIFDVKNDFCASAKRKKIIL